MFGFGVLAEEKDSGRDRADRIAADRAAIVCSSRGLQAKVSATRVLSVA